MLCSRHAPAHGKAAQAGSTAVHLTQLPLDKLQVNILDIYISFFLEIRIN
jgi:hypothetical protein